MREVDSDLLLEIQSGNLEGVREALEKGANINAIDSWGKSALYNAVYGGHKEIVELLIHLGAPVDKHSNGASLLHVAARQPTIFFKSEDERPALMHSYAEIARLLISKLDPQYSTVEIIHHNGGSSYFTFVDHRDERGCTPLHYAVQSGATEIARMLIIDGANVNALDSKGNTPLHYARFEHSLEAVQLLLLYGADLTLKNHLSDTIGSMDGHVAADSILSLYRIETERRERLARDRQRAGFQRLVTREKPKSPEADSAYGVQKRGLAAISELARSAIIAITGKMQSNQRKASPVMRWQGFKL